jgi:hypothetical protein
MSPKPDKPVNPRENNYWWGTPEEEEAKHLERVRQARERKEKKGKDAGEQSAG